MTVRVAPMPETELAEVEPSVPDAGLGALHTERGNLPLELIEVRAAITGLIADVELTQGFRNPHDVPIEATYIFPLPDRAAVTRMRMAADDRVIEGVLEERGKARADYDRALAEGKRASIAEEERPDVFTMRVGNILPGERVTIRLQLAQPLPYADGDATFRLPLVVAPRYIPGSPLPGQQVGDGVEPDTDEVPDASRISPPVLLPGFPNPVRLSIGVDVDPAGLPLGDVRSSLHEVDAEGSRITLRPGARPDRDFILRLAYGEAAATATACQVTMDGSTDGAGDSGREGTFRLTVLPPLDIAPPRPRDVVVVLDRSGSMHGWKMVAARRAAARIVDTLTEADAFAVITFDHTMSRPDRLPDGLAPATDRNRYRAVEHLARVDARGGTEMLAPLRAAVDLLGASGSGDPARRDRVLVLVTDGQVGNEDQILRELAGQAGANTVRVHTIGIDQAVNAGFLGRLAGLGGGRCELVESEDRLDEAATRIHHRISAPLLRQVRLDAPAVAADTVAPARLPDLFPGVPLVIAGRWHGEVSGASELTVSGVTGDGEQWSATVPATAVANRALTATWARAHLRDLEDRYVTGGRTRTDQAGTELEQRIVATSLRFGVLCRFTAFVAVDSRVVTDGGPERRVVQPVEPAAGWDMLRGAPGGAPAAVAPMAMAAGAAPQPAPGVTMESGVPPVGIMGGPAVARARSVRPAGFGRQLPGSGFAPSGGRGGREQLGDLVLAHAREQAAAEARQLRAAGDGGTGLDERTRRTLLADLASRLHAVVVELSGRGRPAEAVGLAELVEALRACEGPQPPGGGDLERLWQLALTALDAFAGGAGGPGAAGGTTSPADPAQPADRPRRRSAFWKRP